MANMDHDTNLCPKDIISGKLTRVETEFGAVLLTALGDEIVGFSAKCPHAGENLEAGGLSHNRISCPKHGWKFNIQSGRTVYPPDEACRLRRYPIKIINERLCIQER